ncbi:MAG: hypothetical protein ACWIPJ_10120 [Polaribacter sp.]
MEETKSIIEVEIELYNGSILRNHVEYALIFNKTKHSEASEIDGVLTLPNPIQKTLSSTKRRQVLFKTFYTLEEIDFIKPNQRFRIMDYEENRFAGKGKVLEIG